MKYYLVTEDGNWADEFDLEAYALYEAESEQALKDKLWKYISDKSDLDEEEEDDGWPKEYYFGTNEAVEYNSKEEVFADLGISELTKLQYDVIKEVLGTSFGTGAIL